MPRTTTDGWEMESTGPARATASLGEGVTTTVDARMSPSAVFRPRTLA